MLNRLTDVNFVVPALVIGLLAIMLSNKVSAIGNIVK